MFNLEQAIAEWRQEMLAAGIKAPALLEELEGHLREDIERQVKGGMDASRAFETAVCQVGEAVALKKEFSKAGNSWLIKLRKLQRLLFRSGDLPIPEMGDFEAPARHALELAPDEARHFQHDFVGTEHLLLGLTRSGSQPLANVMQKLGLSREVVRWEIEQIVAIGPVADAAPSIPFTPRARQALRLAVQEAKSQNQRHVKAEHVFLGLLDEGGGVAAMVLKKLGVRRASARVEILKEIGASRGAG